MTSSVTEPTVRDTATVTVKEAVDGTRKRRRVHARGPKGVPAARDSVHIKVRRDVWLEACAVVLTTQRIKIVSHTEVLIVNAPAPWKPTPMEWSREADAWVEVKP